MAAGGKNTADEDVVFAMGVLWVVLSMLEGGEDRGRLGQRFGGVSEGAFLIIRWVKGGLTFNP